MDLLAHARSFFFITGGAMGIHETVPDFEGGDSPYYAKDGGVVCVVKYL
jgi:hypothetical protein